MTWLNLFYWSFTSYPEQLRSSANCTRELHYSLLPLLQQRIANRPASDKAESQAGSQEQSGNGQGWGTPAADRAERLTQGKKVL